jgi:broad specificity phosphatase PhoE
MQVYFVRHGFAKHNEEFLKFGESAYYDSNNIDSSLVEKGIEQAKEVGLTLKEIKFDKIYSSSLTRCIQTTDIIVKNETVYLNDFLLEPQGYHICNYRKDKFGVENFCNNLNNKYNLDFINNECGFIKETEDMIKNRILAFYNMLINDKKNNFNTVLVVSHHDVINKFFKYIYNIDYSPKNCEIKKIIL